MVLLLIHALLSLKLFLSIMIKNSFVKYKFYESGIPFILLYDFIHLLWIGNIVQNYSLITDFQCTHAMCHNDHTSIRHSPKIT